MTAVPTPPSKGVTVELDGGETGNSLAVVLPEEIISRPSIQDGPLPDAREAPDGGDRIVPHGPGLQDAMAKAEDIIARYRNTLHVLAR